MPVAAVVGVATAALVGVALAKTFTLQVAKNARVMNAAGTTKRGNIVVNPRWRAVYALSGDSQHHPECTKASGCFQFWPPVTVSSPKKLSKGPGVAGRLGVWRRDGFFQVTLGGHPLYAFAADAHKSLATGEGLRSFGGTWHVIKASAAKQRTTTTPPGPTTTTSTPPCLYPPCY
jgi:predicted lipoprotein with Yx(FWY)xxD motif